MDEHAAPPATAVRRMLRMMGAGMRARRALKDPGPLLEEWVASVGRLKGIAMKMGQIMSYIDVTLPDEARQVLARLQTASASMPIETVRAILDEDLGARAGAVGIDARPVSSASIGQVHRGTLETGQDVAVKVRFPEVEDAIRSDFRWAGAAPAMARLMVPTADVRPLLDEAKRQFLLECDYVHEARMQTRFAALHAGDPDLVIPAVHASYSTPRVLVSDWIEGTGLEAYLASGPSQRDRDRVGQAIHRFYVGSLFRGGIYNGDPHPGNQLYLGDGRVAVLDHGCSRSFDHGFVADLARLSLAARADDDALDAVLVRMGIATGRRLPDARRFVHAFYAPFQGRKITLAGGKDMASILQDKRRLMRLRLPGAFLFLLRVRFGLASLLARLDARGDWAGKEKRWAEDALTRS